MLLDLIGGTKAPSLTDTAEFVQQFEGHQIEGLLLLRQIQPSFEYTRQNAVSNRRHGGSVAGCGDIESGGKQGVRLGSRHRNYYHGRR